MLAAISEGFRRTASAPAVLLGTLALTYLFSVPPVPLEWLLSPSTIFSRYGAMMPLLPFGGSLYNVREPAWLVMWAFLGGGILDRYARNRPTRGRGFFGACGAHFPAMLRLSVIEWLVGFAAAGTVFNYSRDAAIVVSLATSVFFVYARGRLVIEDRRSAIGALLAGGRFIRRNAAAGPVVLVFSAAMWLLVWRWGKWTSGVLNFDPLQFIGSEVTLALLQFLVFASWASAIAFFQSRLAHASYTAGPPLEWPESPAAEAITNLAPARDS